MMTDKQKLESLLDCYEMYTSADGVTTIEEYKNDPRIRMLREFPEWLEKYMKYYLPEIALFICSSEKKMGKNWNEDYAPLKDIIVKSVEDLKLENIKTLLENDLYLTTLDAFLLRKVSLTITLLRRKYCDMAKGISDKCRNLEIEIEKNRIIAKRKKNVGVSSEIIGEEPMCERSLAIEICNEEQRGNIPEESSLQSNTHFDGVCTVDNQSVLMQSDEDTYDDKTVVIEKNNKNNGKNKNSAIENKANEQTISVNEEEVSISENFLFELNDSLRETLIEKKEIDKNIEVCDILIKRCYELENTSDSRIRIQREKMFSDLPEEEIVLYTLLNNDAEVPHGVKSFFGPGNKGKQYRFLNLIRNEEFAIPLIIRLYRSDVIDLECYTEEEKRRNIFYSYLVQNPEMFENYLIQHFPQSLEKIEEDVWYKVLFEMAFMDALKTLKCSSIEVKYSNLWNCIEDVNIWNWMLDIIRNRTTSDEMDDIITAFAQHIHGRTAKAFIDSIEKNKLSFGRFIKLSLKGNEKNINVELVSLMVNRCERNLLSVQRDLNRALKRIDEQPGRIFSALKEPIEMLEELTMNIKGSKVELSNKIVSGLLIDVVSKIRSGLEEVDLFPVENIDKWANSSPIIYEIGKHKFEKGEDMQSSSITLDTLGFRYQERGEAVCEPAKVIAFVEERGEENGI